MRKGVAVNAEYFRSNRMILNRSKNEDRCDSKIGRNSEKYTQIKEKNPHITKFGCILRNFLAISVEF
jgi:hypothetical protein